MNDDMICLLDVLTVHNKRELIETQDIVTIEPMVQTNDERAAFAQRLQKAANAAGLPSRGRGAKIAQHLGVTPKAVSKYFNAEAIPARDTMIALANMLGVSVSWLQYGESELELMTRTPQRLIPVLDYVQAGAWTEACGATDIDGSTEYIYADPRMGKNAFALRVKGDSMLPEIRPGDVVLIDPDASPRPGEFVVAKNGNGEATIKQYRPRGVNDKGQEWFELAPLNDVFPTMRSDLQTIQLIGVVVEHRRSTRKAL
ncbi:TPA: LexA family protein [Aeromonas hydrophila]|uniref:LexA family protein n=1 Tax=Aeromonas sp. PS2Canimalfood6 TaxID=3397770 RepID=UPI002230119B